MHFMTGNTHFDKNHAQHVFSLTAYFLFKQDSFNSVEIDSSLNDSTFPEAQHYCQKSMPANMFRLKC